MQSGHRLHLSGEMRSARRARALVREVLTAAGRVECLDAAELACTELVTNAVLHAHTDLVLTVRIGPGDVRVEVRDFNPALPVQRHYGVESTTGRGLGLVALVTDTHGVSDVDEHGKTVWFTVGAAGIGPAQHTAQWEPESAVGVSSAGDRGTGGTVQLLGMPVGLWLAALEHHDALLRELAFVHVRHPVHGVDLAAADRARRRISSAVLAAQASNEPPPVGASPHGCLAGSTSSYEARDIVLDVAEGMSADVAALQEALDVVEAFARQGRALVRPGLPEIVAVRDWACGQIIAQLGGVAPAPWRGRFDEHRRSATDPDAAIQFEGVLADVRRSSRRLVAADDTNRIVAVSGPLASTLGWSPDELVGRRIVVLIPERLRDAHVAGFTRHLTTGQSHVLGSPLALPVLRADGTELDCHVLIDQIRHTPARTLYLAAIDPDPLHPPQVASAASPNR